MPLGAAQAANKTPGVGLKVAVPVTINQDTAAVSTPFKGTSTASAAVRCVVAPAADCRAQGSSKAASQRNNAQPRDDDKPSGMATRRSSRSTARPTNYRTLHASGSGSEHIDAVMDMDKAQTSGCRASSSNASSSYTRHQILVGTGSGISVPGAADSSTADDACTAMNKRTRKQPFKPRKSRLGAAAKPVVQPLGSYEHYRQYVKRARVQLSRLAREMVTLTVCGAEGWRGNKREIVQLSSELQRAQLQIVKSKDIIQQCVKYCDDACGDTPLPQHAYDEDGDVLASEIRCSKCSCQESTDDNDIILCDGECGRAYHECCIVPRIHASQLPEDDDWFCPACAAKHEILAEVNEALDMELEIDTPWHKVFSDKDDSNRVPRSHEKVAALAVDKPQAGGSAVQNLLFGPDLDEDDDDGDFQAEDSAGSHASDASSLAAECCDAVSVSSHDSAAACEAHETSSAQQKTLACMPRLPPRPRSRPNSPEKCQKANGRASNVAAKRMLCTSAHAKPDAVACDVRPSTASLPPRRSRRNGNDAAIAAAAAAACDTAALKHQRSAAAGRRQKRHRSAAGEADAIAAGCAADVHSNGAAAAVDACAREKRRRTQVDYVLLNAMMFGYGDDEDGAMGEDDDYVAGSDADA